MRHTSAPLSTLSTDVYVFVSLKCNKMAWDSDGEESLEAFNANSPSANDFPTVPAKAFGQEIEAEIARGKVLLKWSRAHTWPYERQGLLVGE